MAPETRPGKMFFDLRLPDGLTEAEIEYCKQTFEDKLHEIDPFNSGTCLRIGWLHQSEIPIESAVMKNFIDGIRLVDESHALEAIDPQLPGTYCYPGDSEICYHAYALKLDDASWGPDIMTGVKVVIVLAYETPFFFTNSEIRRVNDELEMVKEQKAIAIKKVVDLEIAAEKAERSDQPFRKVAG